MVAEVQLVLKKMQSLQPLRMKNHSLPASTLGVVIMLAAVTVLLVALSSCIQIEALQR